jgi:hypothetical protein
MNDTVGGNLCKRHDGVKHVIGGLLSETGRSNVQSEQALCDITDQCIGRSDVTWTDEAGGTRHADIAITSPTAVTTLKAGAGNKAGVAASLGETAKLRKYNQSHRQVLPVVLEVGVRFGAYAIQWVRANFRNPEAATEAYQTIATCLQRMNAEAIMAAKRALD